MTVAVKVGLRAIRTGTTRLPPGYAYRTEAGSTRAALGFGVPKETWIAAPIGAFLLEHPVGGPVLVDTGMHPVVAVDPKRNLGRLGAAIVRIDILEDENVPARLRRWGVDAEDVTLVLMTHLHPDHTSAMSEFPAARFVTTHDEWRAATGRAATLRGYIGAHLPDRSSFELVDISGGEPHEGLSRTLDYFGDGSVRLVSTPGHTAGHLSVLVETDRGPVFLLGDVVYTLRNLRDDVLPWRTADDDASRRSMAEVRAYAGANPGVPLIPTHDAAVWAELPAQF